MITKEDVTSCFNSVATNNVAEGFDALVSTQDVESKNLTESVTIINKAYLQTCTKNLLNRIDRLKVDFHKLENSFYETKKAYTVELCRKRLTYIVVLIEKISSWKAEVTSTTMCRSLDCTYKTLCGIREQLLELGFKTKNTITKIEGIIDYANNHIRNVVLTLSEQKFKPEVDQDDCTVVCEVQYSNNVNKIKPNVIDIFSSDTEYEVSNNKKILQKDVVVKLEQLEAIKTSLPQTKASISLLYRDSSDTDDSIIENNTDYSNQGSSDPTYHPSDSMTDDCLNLPVLGSSCKKTQRSKKGHSISLKRRRSKLMIDSDSSDESENAVYFKQNVISRKEKTPRQRQRVSFSNKQILSKLRKTLTDTSDESDTENKKNTPSVEDKTKTTPVRTSICSNSHSQVDNSIEACSSGWDDVHQLPRNKTSELCEQSSDEWDYSNESESEITNLWQTLDGEFGSQTSNMSNVREHKVAFLEIRKIFRSLIKC